MPPAAESTVLERVPSPSLRRGQGGLPTTLRLVLRPQAFLTKVWWGQLCVDTGLWRVILCMLAFPLLSTGLVSFRCGLTAVPGPFVPDAPTGGRSHTRSGLWPDPGTRGAQGGEAGEGSHLCEATPRLSTPLPEHLLSPNSLL